MGAFLAKRKADKAKKEAREKAGFHPKRIYYDENGNLRHGWDRQKRNKEEEMAQIIETDSSVPDDVIVEDGAEGKDDDDGKLVYVVNVTWINAWLAFVHLLKTSPEPGPCDNTLLLERDEENKCWTPATELVLARKSKRGDYRHVTEETWKHIYKLYPGSGPAIKVPCFKETNDHRSDGLYDTANWDIDQKGFEKMEEDTKKKKKKRKERNSADAPAAEMVPLVRPSEVDVGMEDAEHKVDERMGKFFGEKKKVESSPKTGPPSTSPTYNPLSIKKEDKKAAAGNDENAWLFS